MGRTTLRVRRLHGTDRGYIVVLVALVISTLLIIAAVVIDFSFLRDDRRADQKVADAAATAGAVTLAATTDGAAACASALDSAIRNLPGVTSFAGADCSAIPAFCDPSATATKTTTGTSGPYVLTVVHPVDDFHPFMTTGSAIGGPARSITPGDGNRCKRVGVGISLDRAASFGGIVDASARTTSVHTVALASTSDGGPLPINLLILERTACDAIRVEGSGTLVVAPIVIAGKEHAGVLAVESDGTGSLCSNTSPRIGTLNVQSAVLRADGPPGCAREITAGTGHGCGDITLYAPGVPGPLTPGSCKSEGYFPACTSNNAGSIIPDPARMGKRHTRGSVDHIFNCKRSYATETWFPRQSVNPCFGAFDNPDLDYVDEVRSFVGATGTTPPGFTRYTGPCDVTAPVVLPEGNVHVPCPLLAVKETMRFGGGNVVFDGDVVVEAAKGNLIIHACGAQGSDNCNPAQPLSWTAGYDYDERQYSSDAAWTLFRNGGTIRKAGGASVTIHDSVVFLGRDAELNTRALDLEGGAGSLLWWATRQGPFDNLALWSDATINHHFAGQANLDLEGVFFAPMGRITYAGTGALEQLAAQFISERLLVTGKGELKIAPNIERAITYLQARSTLIR